MPSTAVGVAAVGLSEHFRSGVTAAADDVVEAAMRCKRLTNTFTHLIEAFGDQSAAKGVSQQL